MQSHYIDDNDYQYNLDIRLNTCLFVFATRLTIRKFQRILATLVGARVLVMYIEPVVMVKTLIAANV